MLIGDNGKWQEQSEKVLAIFYICCFIRKKRVLCIYDDLEGGLVMQKNTQALMEKIGIKELFDIPHGKLQGSTVLATNGKENLTVSQLMNAATYFIKFIEENFDVNEYKYSITIIYLKSVQLVLNNRNAEKPTKEDVHIIIDVMHEIADIRSKSDSEKKLNEEIAIALNCLIETLK